MRPLSGFRLTPRFALFCTALLAGACAPSPVPKQQPPDPVVSAPGPLAILDLRASATILPVRTTMQFTVVGHDADGRAVEPSPTWSVRDGSGTITSGGLFTAGSLVGTFADSIIVTSGAVTAHATVTLTAERLATITITITPGGATLAAQTRVQFVASGKDSFGNAVLLSPTWSVSAGGGTITPEGIFTAGALAGVFAETIEASSNGIIGKATVTVGPGQVTAMTVLPRSTNLAAGETVQFTVTGMDANGNALSVMPNWSAGPGGTITSTGLFTAGSAAGVFPNSVKANLGSVNSFASVTIASGTLARLTLTPTTATMPVNGVQQFFALARDQFGNTISVTPSWSVVGGGGTISTSGLFTAGRSAGVFVDTIKVSSGQFADYVTVTITSDELSVITVTPATVILAPGTNQFFTAFGRDINGNAVSISPNWAASAGGNFDGAGFFTAGFRSGTFINAIGATVGAVTGLASFTVSAGPLAAIAITSPSATMAMNSTLQFAATGTDDYTNPVSLTPTWSVVAGGGTISPLGLFTSGTLAGTFISTIRATSGTISTNVTVTVTPGLLATLTVTPASSTLNIGETQLITVAGRDAFDNAVVVSPTWAVLTGGGAIDPVGNFTAGNVAGTFVDTIRASSGAISGRASIVVNAGPLANVVITGNLPNLEINSTRQLVASGTDGSGNVVPLNVTWTVAAGGGTVSSTGLFTAGSLAGVFTNTVLATSGNITAEATMTLVSSVLASNSIPLLSAKNFAVLAGTSISNSGATAIIGDVGLDPGGPTSVTGSAFWTITGTLHVNDAPAVQAQTDLTAAFLAAQGKVCPTGHDVSGTDLGASPFAPGVYCFSSTAGLTGTLVLDGGGDSSSVFIFQVQSALTTSTGSAYVLQNGARATNVYWVVGSSATLGVNSTFPGTILALTDITLDTGATLIGRTLARNGTVSLDSNPVTVPAP